MKLHENNISFEEIQKIIINKKLKKGDLETFLFHQDGKIVLSFKDSVDIDVNLSEEIRENRNVRFILSSDSTLIGGSNLTILAINGCRIEVGDRCKIWTDDNCEVVCRSHNEIDCNNDCKITVRKNNKVITGDRCQISYNGHATNF